MPGSSRQHTSSDTCPDDAACSLCRQVGAGGRGAAASAGHSDGHGAVHRARGAPGPGLGGRRHVRAGNRAARDAHWLTAREVTTSQSTTLITTAPERSDQFRSGTLSHHFVCASSHLHRCRPTPAHATISSLAQQYWGHELKLQPLLDSKVEWAADVVVELTLYAEMCLDQPNRRPKVGAAPLLNADGIPFCGAMSVAWWELLSSGTHASVAAGSEDASRAGGIAGADSSCLTASSYCVCAGILLSCKCFHEFLLHLPWFCRQTSAGEGEAVAGKHPRLRR